MTRLRRAFDWGLTWAILALAAVFGAYLYALDRAGVFFK